MFGGSFAQRFVWIHVNVILNMQYTKHVNVKTCNMYILFLKLSNF